jgi:hypothetical protein
MARWVLECAQCKVEFMHSEIYNDGYSARDPFTLTAVKPEFPAGGLNAICPNCNSASVYQRYQLLYRTA